MHDLHVYATFSCLNPNLTKCEVVGIGGLYRFKKEKKLFYLKCYDTSVSQCCQVDYRPTHCLNFSEKEKIIPAGVYMFKVNNRNTRTTYEICSKLTIKTTEWCHWCI